MALPQHEYRQEYVAIPSGLFGPLLEGVDDLLELRCALRALFLLHRKKGPLRSVTAAELAGDPVLLGGAQNADEPLAEADVARALRECVAHGVLIAYTAEVRTKEIGIRKILGASEVSIVSLLTKEFLVLVALASLLAWPIAYTAMNGWLQNFAYRIGLSPTYFIASTGVALVITLITIAYQALKAARANPVEALRYE